MRTFLIYNDLLYIITYTHTLYNIHTCIVLVVFLLFLVLLILCLVKLS